MSILFQINEIKGQEIYILSSSVTKAILTKEGENSWRWSFVLIGGEEASSKTFHTVDEAHTLVMSGFGHNNLIFLG